MLTILIADDEFVVLETLSVALESRGYRVLKAGDGADALRLLSSQQCDVVVCDEIMPVMTGAQLLSAMAADPRLSTIPAIMMVDAFKRATSNNDPNVPVVPKPVIVPQLLALVEQAAHDRARP